MMLFRVLAVALSVGPVAWAQTAPRHVKQERLWATLEKLSEFGRPPGAGFEGGVTRLGFSDADLSAREYVTGLMRDAGLEVRVDPAGNIFGRREGADPSLPVLLFGSHIDSVPGGGNFDGDVGTLGAIEVVRALNDHGVRTRHPLEVVIWTHEEGSTFGHGLFGSSAASGQVKAEVLARRDAQGTTLADWLRRYGQDPARLAEARIPRGRVAAYLELHIEQGPVLDESRAQIGVVQGIVGINDWLCTATGFANHAGTTPMDRRQDALAAASRAVLAVREEVRRETGRAVGTVGNMKVSPGGTNVVPGSAEFPVELRDLNVEIIESMWRRIEQRFAAIGREENAAFDCQLIFSARPALTDTALRDVIRDAARTAGFSTMDLPSGAGHDAQQVSYFAPVGMIFVPSRDGISHSPREYSSPAAVASGAEVLYRALLALDARP